MLWSQKSVCILESFLLVQFGAVTIVYVLLGHKISYNVFTFFVNCDKKSDFRQGLPIFQTPVVLHEGFFHVDVCHFSAPRLKDRSSLGRIITEVKCSTSHFYDLFFPKQGAF